MDQFGLTRNLLHFPLSRKNDLPLYTIVHLSEDSRYSLSHPLLTLSSETVVGRVSDNFSGRSSFFLSIFLQLVSKSRQTRFPWLMLFFVLSARLD